MKTPERKYKIHTKVKDGEKKDSIAASNPSEAVRKLYETASFIKLKPAETIVYDFEAEMPDHSMVKGQVWLARSPKEGGEVD